MYAQHSSERHLSDVIEPDFIIETGLTFTSSHDVGSPTWTMVTEEIRKKRVNNQMTVDIRILSSSIDEAADQFDIEVPDSLEADGNFASVVMVNNTACKCQVFDGGTVMTISSAGSDFPTGAIEIYGQIIFQVQDP